MVNYFKSRLVPPWFFAPNLYIHSMKKIFTLFSILVVSVSSIHSQAVHIGVSGGYCLPLATDYGTVHAEQFEINYYPHYYTGYRKITPRSSGQGANLAMNIDWFSKSNIGLGLKLNALFSSPVAYSYRVEYLGGTIVNYDYTSKAFSFQFVPHASFKHDFKVVSPVLEMGMLIGLNKVNESYNAASASGGRQSSDMNINGNIMLGFYSSLGLAFRVSPVIRLSLAVNCTAGSYSPSKWERTSFFANGVNRLNDLSTFDREGIFVKELDQTSPQQSNEPRRELKYAMPFSNVGINAGIIFVLSKKQVKKAPGPKDKPEVHPF